MAKLNDYFKVRKNMILERARLNRRSQLQGESAEQYITTLYWLAETCEYGELTSPIIRDRLVVGIQDMFLSERMQMDADLTLEKTKKLVRQREAVKEHKELLGDIDKQPMVEQIRHKYFGRSSTVTTHPNQKNKNTQSQQAKCKRCGNKPHPHSKCPAKDSVCHRCKRKGHYSS